MLFLRFQKLSSMTARVLEAGATVYLWAIGRWSSCQCWAKRQSKTQTSHHPPKHLMNWCYVGGVGIRKAKNWIVWVYSN